MFLYATRGFNYFPRVGAQGLTSDRDRAAARKGSNLVRSAVFLPFTVTFLRRRRGGGGRRGVRTPGIADNFMVRDSTARRQITEPNRHRAARMRRINREKERERERCARGIYRRRCRDEGGGWCSSRPIELEEMVSFVRSLARSSPLARRFLFSPLLLPLTLTHSRKMLSQPSSCHCAPATLPDVGFAILCRRNACHVAQSET